MHRALWPRAGAAGGGEEAVARLEDLGRGEVEFVLALTSFVIKAEQTKIRDLHEARHLTEKVEAVEGGFDVVCRVGNSLLEGAKGTRSGSWSRRNT